MAGVGLANDIGRQGTDSGDGDVVCGVGRELGHGRNSRGVDGGRCSEKCSYIPADDGHDRLISNHTSGVCASSLPARFLPVLDPPRSPVGSRSLLLLAACRRASKTSRPFPKSVLARTHGNTVLLR